MEGEAPAGEEGAEVDLDEEIAEFFGDLLGWVAEEGGDDELFGGGELAALEGEGGGAAVEDGAGWFGGPLVGKEGGGLGFSLAGLLEEGLGAGEVALEFGEGGAFSKVHGLLVEGLDRGKKGLGGVHRWTMVERG